MTAPNRLHMGIVLTLSAEPLDLPAGPLKLLLRLRQLAGKARCLDTKTSSLAKLFSRTTNTIRAWRAVLEEYGYIHVFTVPRTGITTYWITEQVEPPSRRALMEKQRQIDALPKPLPWQKPKPNLMGPEPKTWWQFPKKSAFWLGGAKPIALIKTR